jgi:putative FmdB family regulatory protein
MPIYSYRCTQCGVQFDRHQSYTDATLVKCPECGKNSLRKVFTPAGIIFKGSGWYATDNRSPSGQTPSREKQESAEGAKPAAEPAAAAASSSPSSSDAGAKPAPAAKPAENKS